jgi:peptide/nickel transport system ATP-binding protein
MAQRVMIAMAFICSPELLIADEPTTALDVTIQAQILDLLREVRSQMNTAVILITHDMGVIAETADRVAVMYAGRIVEEADAKSLFATPLHPYTQGLLNSIPILGQTKERLAVIPGSVPDLIGMGSGCRFAARCQARIKYGLSICTEEEPELRPIMGVDGTNHQVRCWLYHDSDHNRDHDSVRHVAPLSTGRVLSAVPPNSYTIATTDIVSTGNGQPRIDVTPIPAQNPATGQDLLQIIGLVKHFPVRSSLLRRTQSWVRAVDNVSFTIRRGETLGLVGESGCGKTTVGRTILGLIPATSGSVTFEGRDIFTADSQELKRLRRDMQLIFQDPFSSLDPRMRVGESITVGLRVHGMQNARERREVAADLLRKVGLEEYHARRYPHEFSGGQRQRIGIARALALQPKFIVCDEPVSALDVSIQSQVLNLLRDLQRDFDLTYLFIAHDLSVVEHISDRVAVMYLGKLVELADRDELYRRPLHPYTQALMSAIPIPDPFLKRERLLLEGEVPSAQNPPPGCRFHTRCPFATEVCVAAEPEFRDLGSVNSPHWVACHYAEQFL